MEIILTPPIAFLIYVPFVILILLLGKGMAGKSKDSELKETVYASGEEASTKPAAPGYRPYSEDCTFPENPVDVWKQSIGFKQHHDSAE